MTRLSGRAAAALLLVAVSAGVLAGCAPGTPDEDSWRDDATRSVGEVLSAVQTARLTLAQSRRGRLHHAYVQAALLDAEHTGSAAAQTLSAVQPPDVERGRAADVGDLLDQAAGVVTDARIAVVADDDQAYAALLRRLDRAASDLKALQTALEHPPRAAR